MKHFLTNSKKAILVVIACLFLTNCAAVPYLAVAAGGYVTSEIVDVATTPDSAITVEEGGSVHVTNEATPLPETPIGFLAYLLDHIWSLSAFLVVFWFMPSPAKIVKCVKGWLRERKEQRMNDARR